MRAKAVIACCCLLVSAAALVLGQGGPTAPPPAFPPQTISLPTFTSHATVAGTNYTYTLLGNDPAKGGTTTIPTVLAAIKLTIQPRMDAAGNKAVLDAGPVANQVIASPIFADYQFASGTTQYADAVMRADFHEQGGSGDWHTRLGQPKVITVNIDVPVGRGYVLTSKKTGRMLAMVDLRFMQQELFKQLPKDAVTAGTLLLAVARDTTYYVNADATQCCHWGTYGVDTSAGARQPFVLGTYLDPNVADVDADVQPIAQQLARFFRDPLHDPLYRGARGAPVPGNAFPAWTKVPARTALEQPRQNSAAGGSGIASGGNDPTDTNWKNAVQASAPFVATVGSVSYHLQNVALLQSVQPGGVSDLAQPRVQLSGRERASRSRQTGARGPARRRRLWRGHGSRGGCREAGGHGGNDRRTERAQIDRLLVRIRPDPRRLATVGRHPRGVRHAGSQCRRRPDAGTA